MRANLPVLLALALVACPPSVPDETDTPDDTAVEVVDADGDGVAEADDCDDADPSVGVAPTWYADRDGDGYGNPDEAQAACSAPEFGLTDASDCDDEDPDVHPAATELCDSLDQDCDGAVDDECVGVGCGNGIVEEGEVCDRDDADACPGRCSVYCGCPSQPPGDLLVEVLDVGQGDSILVVSPDGYSLLIDAGPYGESWDIERSMVDRGVTALDYVLVTHDHSDHYGSMSYVLEDHPEVQATFDHGHDSPWSGWTDYVAEAGDRRRQLKKGYTLDLGPAMTVDVIHSWMGADNENWNSIVLRLQYGETSFLLGGDCEAPCEDTLQGEPVDFYKVHHHGSSDSTSDGLMDRFDPTYAAISVGKGNDFGHPTETVLDRLDAYGVECWRTDQDGNVVVTSDGGEISVSPVH